MSFSEKKIFILLVCVGRCLRLEIETIFKFQSKRAEKSLLLDASDIAFQFKFPLSEQE